MRRYIDHCSDLNYRLRYIGSMVSDIHRIMFQGGIFLYPNTRKYPKGKLRLLYECYPMSFLIEQAGGTALTCKLERVLDLEIKSLHQTSSIVMGSRDMVRDMKEFVEKYGVVV
jgi:fructose-1,6-bisphosphatase I